MQATPATGVQTDTVHDAVGVVSAPSESIQDIIAAVEGKHWKDVRLEASYGIVRGVWSQFPNRPVLFWEPDGSRFLISSPLTNGELAVELMGATLALRRIVRALFPDVPPGNDQRKAEYRALSQERHDCMKRLMALSRGRAVRCRETPNMWVPLQWKGFGINQFGLTNAESLCPIIGPAELLSGVGLFLYDRPTRTGAAAFLDVDTDVSCLETVLGHLGASGARHCEAMLVGGLRTAHDVVLVKTARFLDAQGIEISGASIFEKTPGLLGDIALDTCTGKLRLFEQRTAEGSGPRGGLSMAFDVRWHSLAERDAPGSPARRIGEGGRADLAGTGVLRPFSCVGLHLPLK